MMAEPSSEQDSVDTSGAESAGAGLDLRIILAVILVVAIAAVFLTQPGAETPLASSPATGTGSSDTELSAAESDDERETEAAPSEGTPRDLSQEDRELLAEQELARFRGVGEAEPPAGEGEEPEEIDDELKDDPAPRPKPRRRPPKIDLGPVPEGVKTVSLDGGRILIFPKQRRIWIGGRICQDDVPIEYFAVFVGGKDHEAVMTVDADPVLLNTALIILNLKYGGGISVAGDIDVPKGDPVHFYVEWKTPEGKTKRVNAEELIWRREEQVRMRDTPWIYTGSRFTKDRETGRQLYMAALDGVMAAVYRDPNAIFNNPRPSGSNDDVYGINTKLCPEIGTPLKIVIEAIPVEEYQKLRKQLIEEVQKIKVQEKRRQQEANERIKARREAMEDRAVDDNARAPDDRQQAPAAP